MATFSTIPNCWNNDECIMQDEDANFAADTISELMNGCPLMHMPDLETGLLIDEKNIRHWREGSME